MTQLETQQPGDPIPPIQNFLSTARKNAEYGWGRVTSLESPTLHINSLPLFHKSISTSVNWNRPGRDRPRDKSAYQGRGFLPHNPVSVKDKIRRNFPLCLLTVMNLFTNTTHSLSSWFASSSFVFILSVLFISCSCSFFSFFSLLLPWRRWWFVQTVVHRPLHGVVSYYWWVHIICSLSY